MAGLNARVDAGTRTARWLPEVSACAFVALPVLVRGGSVLNADTKLYLTADPARLMGSATQAWDATQFAGYVPHQAVAYLWPTGPYHWIAARVGVPEWLAQRLFVALLFVFAAAGVARFLRSLGSGSVAVFAGALAYAASPYVLPYQSRTSSMLLPWAALGWACLFARRGRRESGWRWPAGLALLIGTAGAVNGAAVLLVLPAIAIVALLPTDVRDGMSTARHGLVFLVRGALLTVGTSLWWIVAVMIQGAHGADVLAYSETVEDVASTANAFEVLRGFGYWLNYVGLDGIPATTAAQAIIASRAALLATLLIPTLALIGLLAGARHTARLGALLMLTGTILAIGVHPLGSSAPLVRPLADNPETWLALALRSSTRAIPVLSLGVAIGVAILADAVDGRWRRASSRPGTGRPAWVVAIMVAIAVVVGDPARLRSGVVDPSLSRPAVAPADWSETVRRAEQIAEQPTRLLQVPGQEFGAHTWGFTLDPVLPSLTQRQVLIRDLLPLGAPQTMDLLWALDETGRNGDLNAARLADLSRLLAVGAVIIPGDLDLDRFVTPSQTQYASSNGLDAGAERVGPHLLVKPDATTSILRQQRGHLLVDGSGKGVVDSAGRGLLGTATVRYVADVDDSALVATMAEASGLVVTDTNTSSARHWRGTRDTVGYPESTDGSTALLRATPGDRRLHPFEAERDSDRTSFVHDGPVTATATDYGQRTRLLPEHRPFNAVDGDESTAWLTDRFGDARGQIVSVTYDSPVMEIALLQPGAPANRRIATVSISIDGGRWREVALGEASTRLPGQAISLAGAATNVRIRIDETRPIPDTDRSRGVDGVGFAEISSVHGPSREVGLLPTRGLRATTPDTPIAVIVTRLRSPEWDASRMQAETVMRRRVMLPRPVRVIVRVAARDSSSTPIVRIAGATVTLVPDTTPGLWRTATTIDLPSGAVDIDTSESRVLVDSVELRDERWATNTSPVITEMLQGTGARREATISPCTGRCWLVFAEGWNPAWTARLGATNLGEPVPVDAVGNGWYFPEGHPGGVLRLEFGPQRHLDIALAASLLTALACVGLVLRRRRELPVAGRPSSRDLDATGRWHRAILLHIGAGVTTALVVPFPAGVVVGLVSAFALWRLGPSWLARIGVSVTVVALAWGWFVIARDRPVARFVWPGATEHLHVPILAGLCMACIGVVLLPTRTDAPTKVRRDGDNDPS